tara:strand:+ start:8471 stop:8944 length:474 start_codon:yes stop_codon:yes gene_type:complete
MPKVDLELVKRILERNELDIRQVSQILEDINVELTGQIDDEEKPPPVKKQFVIMVSDPKGDLEAKDYIGWVLQIPEEDSPYVSQERLIRSAYEFNQSKKGRRLPVRTIGETCENVSTRILKEQNIWVKTKEPVMVVTTNNKIPFEKAQKEEPVYAEA